MNQPQSPEPSANITGGLSSPSASQAESVQQSTNISRNPSTLSMNRPSTPVSFVRLPASDRSTTEDGTISYAESDVGVSGTTQRPMSGLARMSPDPNGYLSAAVPRGAGGHQDTSRIPVPMFDSFVSITSMEDTFEGTARAGAPDAAAVRDVRDDRPIQAAGVRTPPAPLEPTRLHAEKLRCTVQKPDPTLHVKKLADLSADCEVGEVDLPLHVKIDMARAQRRPTAIAKLGEWQPYEAAPAENYLFAPPLKFFQLRWAFMKYNPLTWHCSGNAYTVGEALMTFAIIGQMIVTGFWWAIDPDFRVNVSVTGTMAVFILMLTFFMAIHSNVIALLLLGLPFDRQLPWHKLLAVSTCFHSVIHFIAFYAGGRSDTMPTDAESDYHFAALWKRNAYGMEVSGWLLSVPIFAMTFMGWSYISRRCFAYFYKVHILSAAGTIIGVMLHGFGAAITKGVMPLALPGGAFWLLDLALRATFGAALTRANATKLRLIPAPTAGGSPVVSIEVPHARGRNFTAGQWVFVCLPKLGVLHWHPFTIASSSNDGDMRVAIACKGKWTGRLAELASKQENAKVYVEGPYGSPMIDVHGTRYKSFVLVAGGIGWTFLRSWRRQLLQDACRGRPVKSVTTITVLRGVDQHQASEILDSPAIEGPLILPSDLELQDNVFLTGVPKRPVIGLDGVARDFEPVSLPGVNTTCGRPDFFTLLSDAADVAKALGETRVAVLICGSLGIVRSIQDILDKLPTDVEIDLHYEVLAF